MTGQLCECRLTVSQVLTAETIGMSYEKAQKGEQSIKVQAGTR